MPIIPKGTNSDDIYVFLSDTRLLGDGDLAKLWKEYLLSVFPSTADSIKAIEQQVLEDQLGEPSPGRGDVVDLWNRYFVSVGIDSVEEFITAGGFSSNGTFDLTGWSIHTGTGQISETPTSNEYLTKASNDNDSWASGSLDNVGVYVNTGVDFRVQKSYSTNADTGYTVTHNISFGESGDQVVIRYYDNLGTVIAETGSTDSPSSSSQVLTHSFTTPSGSAGTSFSIRISQFSTGNPSTLYFNEPVVTVAQFGFGSSFGSGTASSSGVLAQTGVGSASGSGTASGSGITVLPGSGSSNGSGTSNGSGELSQTGSGASTGSGTSNASGGPIAITGTASAAGTGTTSGSGGPIEQTGNGSANGSGSSSHTTELPDTMLSGEWTVSTGSAVSELDFVIVTAPDSNAPITQYDYTTDSGTTWRTLTTGTSATVTLLSTGSAINSGQVFDSVVAVRAVSAAGNGLESDNKTVTAGAAGSSLDSVTFSGDDYFTNTGSGSAGWDLGFGSSVDGMSGYINFDPSSGSGVENLLYLQDRVGIIVRNTDVFAADIAVSGGSASVVSSTDVRVNGATEIWFSIDCANGTNELYLDGVDDLDAGSSNTYSANVDLSPSNDWQTENMGSLGTGSTYNGSLTRICIWETALDITSSTVRTDMADETETANLGTAPLDAWGTLSEWNANTVNNGTGGDFSSKSGTLT